jgi:hypothetical protein
VFPIYGESWIHPEGQGPWSGGWTDHNIPQLGPNCAQNLAPCLGPFIIAGVARPSWDLSDTPQISMSNMILGGAALQSMACPRPFSRNGQYRKQQFASRNSNIVPLVTPQIPPKSKSEGAPSLPAHFAEGWDSTVPSLLGLSRHAPDCEECFKLLLLGTRERHLSPPNDPTDHRLAATDH